MYGISDIDLIYFDSSDFSYEAEERVIKQAKESLHDCKFHLDIKNQARVHLWYEKHFGIQLKPYQSSEEAITTWPTTASAIGVRLMNDEFVVYATYGLNDMFAQIIRANKKIITQDVYNSKCEKWKSKWNTLTIICW